MFIPAAIPAACKVGDSNFVAIPVPSDNTYHGGRHTIFDKPLTAAETSARWRTSHPKTLIARATTRKAVMGEHTSDYNTGVVAWRKYKYGVTDDVFNTMLAAQNGLCAICGKPETSLGRTGRVKPLSIDHDHATGKVRGLLCHGCNIRLGWYEQQEFGIHSYLAKVR
jgi:hypothetical protein